MKPEPTVELFYDGVWNEAGDWRLDSAIEINRGRRDEAKRADPASCSLVLNNRHGNYSPRNPLSTLYGKIGRNTPLRVRLGESAGYLWLPGTQDSYAWVPDAAALDITGDIDIRIDLEPETWRQSGGGIELARKAVTTIVQQRSWFLVLEETGEVQFVWSTDGTSATAIAVFSTAAIPGDSDRLAIRITLDVDNGASGKTVTFYTAPAIVGPWTQLGDPVVTAGVTSIFASTSNLEVGRTSAVDSPGLGKHPLLGKLYGFELRDGIDGTVVASEDFTDLVLNSPWVLNGSAKFVDESVRFAGEVVAWPPRWDLSDSDVWVPIEAAGILRRLNQGQKPLRSALFRDISTRGPNVVGYWPMEEGEGATQFASGIDDLPATWVGALELANYDDLIASAPLPTFGEPGVSVVGMPSGYVGSGRQRVFMFVHAPADGIEAEHELFRVHTTGTATHWIVSLLPNGNMRLKAFANTAEVLTSLIGFAMNGSQSFVSLRLEQDGADIDWRLTEFEIDGSGSGEASATLNAQTLGEVWAVSLRTEGEGLGDTPIGHVTVLDDDVDDIWEILESSAIAWWGEPAGDRLKRLAADEDVDLLVVGDPGATVTVGEQEIAEFLEILEEAAEADLGFLGEQMEALGLLYRTRLTLYNQAPALTLDYANGEIFEPITPTDDDQLVRNEVTVKRRRGSSTTARLEEGSLSVQPAPDGIGLYDTQIELSLALDGQTHDQASWRLHMGTVDELRVPSLTLNLANLRMEAHLPAIAAIREGDRIQVENTPAWLPPGPLDLIVQGWKETLGEFEREITFHCTPGRVWNVAVVEDLVLGRFDTAGSELASAIDDNDTTLSVAVTEGHLWTTADEPFDIVVGGEEMTVTAVTGASSPQTFTVTRSANGIVKAHSAGADVRLAHPAVVAL